MDWLSCIVLRITVLSFYRKMLLIAKIWIIPENLMQDSAKNAAGQLQPTALFWEH